MYDYVIVGGGSAGCVLANRLSENPGTRVCLLEAGPADHSRLIHMPVGILGLMRSKKLNWAYWTEPQPQLNGRRLFCPRGKTLGGSSSINAMIYTRGHPSDYDRWAALGNRGWSYRELLPYFLRAQHCELGADAYNGVGGPVNVAALRCVNPLSLDFVEAAVAAGYPRTPDFNGAEQTGVGLYRVAQRNGERCSNAVAYLQPARARPNLTVITDAPATRIEFAGRRAAAVHYRQHGQDYRIEAEREVLLCGGAINSPQLLLLSGVGPREELERHGIVVVRELPGVGRNLQDHLDISVVHRARDRVGIAFTPLALPRALRGLWRYQRHRDGEFTSNYAEAGGFIPSQAGIEPADLQMHFLPAIEEHHGLELRGLLRGYGYTLRTCYLRPASRGRVTLASADPLAPPRIDPNYLGDPTDLEPLVRAVKIARAILDQSPLARHRRDELYPGPDVNSDEEIRAYVRARAETIYHPVGTCKMGHDDLAVVDDQLRVHDLEGLRVVDASIMPTLVGGNTNAPTTAIAEKAADLILAAAAGEPLAA